MDEDSFSPNLGRHTRRFPKSTTRPVDSTKVTKKGPWSGKPIAIATRKTVSASTTLSNKQGNPPIFRPGTMRRRVEIQKELRPSTGPQPLPRDPMPGVLTEPDSGSEFEITLIGSPDKKLSQREHVSPSPSNRPPLGEDKNAGRSSPTKWSSAIPEDGSFMDSPDKLSPVRVNRYTGPKMGTIPQLSNDIGKVKLPSKFREKLVPVSSPKIPLPVSEPNDHGILASSSPKKQVFSSPVSSALSSPQFKRNRSSLMNRLPESQSTSRGNSHAEVLRAQRYPNGSPDSAKKKEINRRRDELEKGEQKRKEEEIRKREEERRQAKEHARIREDERHQAMEEARIRQETLRKEELELEELEKRERELENDLYQQDQIRKHEIMRLKEERKRAIQELEGEAKKRDKDHIDYHYEDYQEAERRKARQIKQKEAEQAEWKEFERREEARREEARHEEARLEKVRRLEEESKLKEEARQREIQRRVEAEREREEALRRAAEIQKRLDAETQNRAEAQRLEKADLAASEKQRAEHLTADRRKTEISDQNPDTDHYHPHPFSARPLANIYAKQGDISEDEQSATPQIGYHRSERIKPLVTQTSPLMSAIATQTSPLKHKLRYGKESYDEDMVARSGHRKEKESRWGYHKSAAAIEVSNVYTKPPVLEPDSSSDSYLSPPAKPYRGQKRRGSPLEPSSLKRRQIDESLVREIMSQNVPVPWWKQALAKVGLMSNPPHYTSRQVEFLLWFATYGHTHTVKQNPVIKHEFGVTDKMIDDAARHFNRRGLDKFIGRGK